MKPGWKRLPFVDVLEDVSAGNEKTQQSEYLPEGRFAVVDQGKALVAGYVDDAGRLCSATLPVVVFGDHTCCFKFIDFPFCMGADGTKILRPRGGNVPKYLYYYLRQLVLTEGGYDRHFKYLKRQEVVVPPIPEQQRIAKILDAADALRAKRRAALARLDTLVEAIFVEMFGDPITNPLGWPVQALGTVFDIARGGSPRPIDQYFTDDPSGVNWVLISDAADKYINSTKKRILPSGVARSRRVRPGDFLLTNSMSFGRPYIMNTDGCIHDGWLVLSQRVNTVNADYFYQLLGSPAVYAEFKRLAPGATVKNLNIDLVKGVRVPIAPAALQTDFSRRVAAVEKLKAAHRASLAEMDALFASLQHRAFRGEL